MNDHSEMRKNMAFSPYRMSILNNQEPITLGPYTQFINEPPTSSEYMKILEEDVGSQSSPIVSLDTISDIYEEESLIMKDLLNVLMGQEGIYIRYSNVPEDYHNNNNNNNDNNGKYLYNGKRGGPVELLNLQLPEYKINKKMNPSIKQICKKSFIKLGKCIFFINRFNKIVLENEDKFGIYLTYLVKYEIMESFLMNDYYKFVVETIGWNHYTQDCNGYSLRNLEYEMLKMGYVDKVLKIYKIYCSYIELFKERLTMDRAEAEFNMFMDTSNRNSIAASTTNNNNSNRPRTNRDYNSNGSQGKLNAMNSLWVNEDTKISEIPKGGNVIRLVYKTGFDKMVLKKYVEDLNCWCLYGKINDTVDEFLISDLTKNQKNNNNNNKNSINGNSKSNDEKLWDIRFNIRRDGLLFEEIFGNDESLLYKILTTGKFLHIYHLVVPCEELHTLHNGSNNNNNNSNSDDDSNGFSTLVTNLITVDTIKDINLLRVHIDRLYEEANLKFYTLFEKGYKLSKLLIDLQDFYLLTKSKILNNFVSNSLIELTRYPNEFILNRLTRNFQELIDEQKRGRPSSCDGFNGYELNKFINLNFEKLSLLDVVKQFKLPSLNSLTTDKTNSKNIQKMILQDLQEEQKHLKQQYYDYAEEDVEEEDIEEEDAEEDAEEEGRVSKSNKKMVKKLKRTRKKLVSIYYLNFDAHIPFPLNIVINKTIIVQFQMIQRKLVLIKYMEKLLDDIHIDITKNPYWRYISSTAISSDNEDDMATRNNRGNLETQQRNISTSNAKILKKFRDLHYRMSLFIKHLQEHCYNNVLMLHFDDSTGDDTFSDTREQKQNNQKADNFIDVSNELSNKLIDCVLELGLTNNDLVYLEFKIFDRIFQYCKYLKNVKNKLPLIDYNLYLFHQQEQSSNNKHYKHKQAHTTTNTDQEDEQYDESKIESIISDDFLFNYNKHSSDFTHILKLYKTSFIESNDTRYSGASTGSGNRDKMRSGDEDGENRGEDSDISFSTLGAQLFLRAISNLI